LNITVPTVRTHIDRLFRKFDLNDRMELLVYVFVLLRNGGDNDKNSSAAVRHRHTFAGMGMERHERTTAQKSRAE
jgi:hypothetical protein